MQILATVAVVVCLFGISCGNRAVPVRSQIEIVNAVDRVFRTRALVCLKFFFLDLIFTSV